MEAYAELEQGTTCERFAPALAALAAGSATSEQMLELRPHLRACSACRATVRDLHMSSLRRVRAFGPIPALGWMWDRLRPGGGGRVLPDGAAAAPPSPDVTIERFRPLARVRQDVTQLMHRAGNADVTTGIQIAAASGGGRVATLGAIVGLCLSGVGAGTVCVVRGVSPLGWLHPEHKAPLRVHHAKPSRTPTPVRAAASISAPPKFAAVARVSATPTPQASRPRAAAPKRHTAAQGVDATTRGASEQAESEFGFEQSSSAEPRPPPKRTAAPDAPRRVDPIQEEFGP
jgi:hypothetical protein